MAWSKFKIKILGVHFGKSVLDNSNWEKKSNSLTQKSIFETECNSLWDENKIKE